MFEVSYCKLTLYDNKQREISNRVLEPSNFSPFF